MSIGQLSSNGQFSTQKYDGATVPTTKFYTTVEDGEIIEMISDDNKIIRCNSITVTANSTDVFFCVWSNQGSKAIPSDYDFTDKSYYTCDAGTSINVSGLPIGAVKILNATGTEVRIEGVSY